MRAWLPLILAYFVGGVAHAAAHPFGFDDMAKLRRLGDFDVSPDGKWVVYALGRADVEENKTSSALWLQPLDRASPPRQLTSGVKKDREPRFSPDGRRLAFVSDRDGAPQVYLLDLGGGEPRKLTAFVEGFGGPIWSPDGKFLVAASEVWPDCKDAAACLTARHQ